MQPHVLLFDIDGTLLNAHGAGRRAANRAFKFCFGRSGVLDHVEMQGMTDPLIFKSGLRTVGAEENDETLERVLAQYLTYLDEELSHDDNVVLLPGVIELLDWLSSLSGPIAIGLGTGNLETGAKAKLDRVGLSSYFSFGGYGSDHEIRSEVLRAGASRGAQQLNVALSSCRIVVIGDTRRDIDAALAIGAECLAVATSNCPLDELRRHGATLATPTLTDPSVRRFICRLAPAISLPTRSELA
jgi:phosphoglycolate phosphatase